MSEIKPYPVDHSYESSSNEQSITNDFSNYDIVKATQYGIFSRCVQLIEQGYNVNTMDSENVSLLHWAAINNRHDIVNYYLSKGANINVIGGDLKSSPIHWAVRQGLLDMVALLLKHGANPNLFDGQGLACIHVASQLAYTHIVAYFLAYGVNVDYKDVNGMTSLMWAAARGTGPDPMRLLITWGANVNIQDTNGFTAGHYAAQLGNYIALKQLNTANINWSFMNKDGMTVHQVLMKRNMPFLANKLDELMVENGRKRHHNFFINLTIRNKKFRFFIMVMLPVLTFLSTGFLFHFLLNYWIKLIMFIMLFAFLRFGISNLVDERAHILCMFSLASSTTFFLCFTYLMFLVPFNSRSVNICFIISISFLMYNFIKCCRSDPGFINVTSTDRINAILSMASNDPTKKVTLNRFCTTCLIQKPIRSKHCSICDRCVAKFDHHCPWIYNCVGVNNHSTFILYLFSLIPSLFLFAYGSFVYCLHFHAYNNDDSLGLAFWRFIVDAMFIHPWIFFCTMNSLFYLFWVLMLFFSQIYQVLIINKTTNERINWDRYMSTHDQKDKCSHSTINVSNPFNMGIVRNFQDTFLSKSFNIDWRNIFSIDEFNNIISNRKTVHEII